MLVQSINSINFANVNKKQQQKIDRTKARTWDLLCVRQM